MHPDDSTLYARCTGRSPDGILSFARHCCGCFAYRTVRPDRPEFNKLGRICLSSFSLIVTGSTTAAYAPEPADGRA